MPAHCFRPTPLAAAWLVLACSLVPGPASAAQPSADGASAAAAKTAPAPAAATTAPAAAAPAPAPAAPPAAPAAAPAAPVAAPAPPTAAAPAAAAPATVPPVAAAPVDVPPTLGTVALPPRPAPGDPGHRPIADAAARSAAAASAPPSPSPSHAAPPSAPVRTAAATDPSRTRPVSADTLEYVRQRLKERLNAQPVQPAATPYDLRVANRTPVERAAAGHGARGAGAGATHEPHWSYEGENGPAAWATLKPGFATCARGERQSPIDIRDGIPVQLEPIRFDYRPGTFRVIDNGHTVQVNVGAGNAIEVMGRRYELRQFHFHRPAEERIDGRAFDMNVHLVHQDGEGRLAVIAVLLERGSALPAVQAVWNNLPLEKRHELTAPHPLDPSQLLPEDRRYYTYMGSLTTPPCTEGVLWMVMRQPVQVSAQQIDIFSRLYPMNARPIQEASGRLIKGPE